MPAEVTKRVKQHREERGLFRVEVEVPSAEDVATVKRFARLRRSEARGAQTSIVKDASNAPVSLEDLIGSLAPAVLPALKRFAAGLALAKSKALIERAHRISANFADTATAQSRAAA